MASSVSTIEVLGENLMTHFERRPVVVGGFALGIGIGLGLIHAHRHLATVTARTIQEVANTSVDDLSSHIKKGLFGSFLSTIGMRILRDEILKMNLFSKQNRVSHSS